MYDSRLVGPAELATPLSSMSSFTSPLLTTSQSSQVLEATDIPQFLNDLTRRFDSDDELEGVLGPVIKHLLSHPSLFRKEGLGGSDNSWRGVIGGLEALVAVKPIAIMITKMPEFIPENADAHNFEPTSLLGPLCRLGVFAMEWVSCVPGCENPISDCLFSPVLPRHIFQIPKENRGVIWKGLFPVFEVH